jgi:HEPN domain-containing protein
VDVERQVEYWLSGSAEDFAAAISLADAHPRHALFFAHLALEKILKAHVTRATSDVPPRIHDLIRLAELARLALTSEQREFLSRFQQYCLAGRYPDQQRSIVREIAPELDRAREMLIWLRNQLR